MSEFKPYLYLSGLLLNLSTFLAWGPSHAAAARSTEPITNNRCPRTSLTLNRCYKTRISADADI